MSRAWEGVIEVPIKGRSKKPRETGLTMVIDKGMAFHQLEDLLESSGEFIDIIKLTFGTSAFHEEKFLRKKNELLTSSGIKVMPGGTFLEVAVWQGVVDEFIQRAKNLGFSAIEVSDGTIEISRKKRREIIKKCLDKGFTVISEAGKKDPQEALSISELIGLIEEDLKTGAFKVIIEAREAGRGVGIFDSEGKIKNEELEMIVAEIKKVDFLIWEAPLKLQQQELILRFGANVNLGNIPPDEVLALEALRQGLRGDTLKREYLKKRDWKS